MPTASIEQIPVPTWLDTVLGQVGLVPPVRVERLQGRNESYAFETSGEAYVAKRLQGPTAAERYARTIGQQALCTQTPTPAVVHHDEREAALLFAAVPDALSGNQLLVDQDFSPELCAQVGTTLGALHHPPCPGVSSLPATLDVLPSRRTLQALPIERVERLTAGEVQAWRLIQADQPLCEAIADLVDRSAAAQRCCRHGDFRVDQIMVSRGSVQVVDWEEFGAGDPAFDTGSWIGEWVYRAALDIPTARGDGIGSNEDTDVLEHRALTSADVVRRGVSKLDALAPQIEAFWLAYGATRLVEADEVRRVVEYAGWHLVERLLALAQAKAMLPGVARAAAGIGRTLMLRPWDAAVALGITPTHASRAIA